jgi:hypothetical protein
MATKCLEAEQITRDKLGSIETPNFHNCGG